MKTRKPEGATFLAFISTGRAASWQEGKFIRPKEKEAIEIPVPAVALDMETGLLRQHAREFMLLPVGSVGT